MEFSAGRPSLSQGPPIREKGKLRPREEKRLRSQAHGGPDPTSATPELFDPAKRLSTLRLSFHMCKMEMLRINPLD